MAERSPGSVMLVAQRDADVGTKDVAHRVSVEAPVGDRIFDHARRRIDSGEAAVGFSHLRIGADSHVRLLAIEQRDRYDPTRFESVDGGESVRRVAVEICQQTDDISFPKRPRERLRDERLLCCRRRDAFRIRHVLPRESDDTTFVRAQRWYKSGESIKGRTSVKRCVTEWRLRSV